MHNERLITAILANDFDAYTEPGVLPGRRVPVESVRSAFGSGPGWDAFVARTRRRWVKWVNKSQLCQADRLVWSFALYESLGERVLDD